MAIFAWGLVEDLGFVMFRLPFLEDSTPPPFYVPTLSCEERVQLDRWFIGRRSQAYYLKRFGEFDKAGRLHARFHWSAFFVTFGWLLYRKRYLDCVVYCVAGWSFIKVNIVIILAICEFLFVGKIPADVQMTVRVAIAGCVWLFWSGMVARWADAYYYRMARREIADALVLYPQDKTAQKAYLEQHGGVSVMGLGVAFGMFGAFLAIIVLQFMPIIAAQKEQAVIFESYRTVSAIQKRVAHIVERTGSCPVGLPVSADGQRVSVEVVASVAGVPTDCAVVATVTKSSYPVRYLNGQHLTIYRQISDGSWRCQTSLNKQQTPKRCVG